MTQYLGYPDSVDGNPCWRWTGAKWVRSDEVQGPADYQDVNQHARDTNAPGSLPDVQQFTDRKQPRDDLSFQQIEGHSIEVPEPQSKEVLFAQNRAERMEVKSSIEQAPSLASYTRIVSDDSLSTLARKVRGQGGGEWLIRNARLIRDARPSTEVSKRRRAREEFTSSTKAASIPAQGTTATWQTGNVCDDVGAVASNKSELRDKLQVITELLKKEGRKQRGEIDPNAIALIAYDLENLTTASSINVQLPPGRNVELEKTNLQKLEEEIAHLQSDLRLERGSRSTALNQLESQVESISRQVRWTWILGGGLALFVVLAAVALVLFQQPWRNGL